MVTVTISIFSRPLNRRTSDAFLLRIPYDARGRPAAIPPNPLVPSGASHRSGLGTHTMPDNLIGAARCHERAAECIKLANASFDQPMEPRYRLLAERYIKLAECEEALEGQELLDS
jgi:hypothetical protein